MKNPDEEIRYNTTVQFTSKKSYSLLKEIAVKKNMAIGVLIHHLVANEAKKIERAQRNENEKTNAAI